MIYLKTSSFLLLNFLFSVVVLGQEVIGSSGGTDSTANSQVTWSVGEAIIETGTVGSTDFTQGYVQPIFLIVSLKEVNSSNVSLSLFPNPANQEFNLVIEGPLESIFYLRITNTSGQLVREESFYEAKHTVNINELLPATYFVEIINEEGSYYSKLKLVKTH
jgi:hypothetical protein